MDPVILVGKDGQPLAVEDGALKIATSANLDIDTTGLASEATLASILAKIIAAPATETTLQIVSDRLAGVGDPAEINIVVSLPAGNNPIGKVKSGHDTSTIYDGSGTALVPKFATIAAASSGDNTLVAAVTAKKIRVLALALIAAGTVNLFFQSAAGGDVIFGGSTNKIALVANAGFVLPYNPLGWFETDSGELLNLDLSAAVAVSGGLVYIEV